MKARWALRGLKFVALALVAAAVFGFTVMSLWNWLAPELFGLRAITFWQALGLVILSKVLFGGFRGGRGYGGHWRHRLNDRWQQMTPAERETFREGMFSRCGRGKVAPEPAQGPRPA